MIFDIEMALCERFTSLSPFAIAEYEAVEVFELVANLSAYIDRQEKGTNGKRQGIYKDNNNGKRYFAVKVKK